MADAQFAVCICGICDRSSASFFCVDCEQYFCGNCKTSHLKTKSCENHTFEDANKLTPDVKNVKCELHKQGYILYCDGCKCLVCSLCLVEKHQQHLFLEIDKAAKTAQEEISPDIKKLRDAINVLRDNRNFLGSFKSMYLTENGKLIDELKEKGEELKKLVEDVTEEIVGSIKEKAQDDIQLITTTIDKLKIDEEKHCEYEKRITQMMTQISTTQFLSKYDELKENLTQLHLNLLPPSVSVRPAKYDHMEISADDVRHILGNIRINIGPFDPGDKVRVKKSIELPNRRWGDVTRYSIGIVQDVRGDYVIANFPEQKAWVCNKDDIEVIWF